jgi:hypothetical protein
MRLIKFHNTPSHFEHDKTLLVVLKIVYLNTAKNQQKIKAMVIQLLANLLHVCLYSIINYRFTMLNVRSVESAECWMCGVLKMRSVECAECWKCGMLKMRSVECAECWKCGVFKMRNVLLRLKSLNSDSKLWLGFYNKCINLEFYICIPILYSNKYL